MHTHSACIDFLQVHHQQQQPSRVSNPTNSNFTSKFHFLKAPFDREEKGWLHHPTTQLPWTLDLEASPRTNIDQSVTQCDLLSHIIIIIIYLGGG